MDLLLFNTVINVVWYLCTFLFFLYRFTSFFNYLYNFARFCGRIWTIGYLIKDRAKHMFYQSRSQDIISNNNSTNQTFLCRIKNNVKSGCQKMFGAIWKKQNNEANEMYIPLFTQQNEDTREQQDLQQEKALFEQHINELCKENDESVLDIRYFSNDPPFQSNEVSLYAFDDPLSANLCHNTVTQNNQLEEFRHCSSTQMFDSEYINSVIANPPHHNDFSFEEKLHFEMSKHDSDESDNGSSNSQ